MRILMLAVIVSMSAAGCAARPNDAEIEKLAAASNQASKTGVCNIHHVRMHKELVRVEYAHLPVDYFSSAYYYAQLQSFPRAREYALSLNPKDESKKFQVFVCPQCKAALREWLAKTAVLFLATDDARFSTGQTLGVDGGMFLHA